MFQQNEEKSLILNNYSIKSPALKRKTRSNNNKTKQNGVGNNNNNKIVANINSNNHQSTSTQASTKLPLTNTLSSPKRGAIRVGSNFQVLSLPEPKDVDKVNGDKDRDLCVWKMNYIIKDELITNFCIDAYTNFGIEPDRALYILFKANYDFNRGHSQLLNRHVLSNNFSNDDDYAFRNAFMYFGKNFARVRQVLPHKTIGSLVEHYYRNKKKQNYKGDYKSYLEIKAANRSTHSDDDNDIDNNSDTMIISKQFNHELHEAICEVCKQVTDKLYLINGLEVCKTCKLYFRATNQHRLFKNSVDEPLSKRHILKCPQDMKQICDEFVEMAKYINNKEDNNELNGNDQLFVVKREKTFCEAKIEEASSAQKLLLINTKHLYQKICEQKNLEGLQKYSFVDALQFLSKTENSFNLQQLQKNKNKINYKWFQREKEAVFNALIRFDGDCNAVAEIIPTKTVNMIKQFYLEYKNDIDEEIQKRYIEAQNINFLNQDELEGSSSSTFNDNKFKNIGGGGNNSNNKPILIELD